MKKNSRKQRYKYTKLDCVVMVMSVFLSISITLAFIALLVATSHK